ncbi:hypothetical protein R1sor_027487 [Riccia sorocarpa]|uniref:DUF4110 domain-containing protein n=1 Tax=Riccia sorocarpa TaxID=122646 RepID=A0ABD3GK29_9MARC
MLHLILNVIRLRPCKQELRKDKFDLAESRYKELKPVLDELEKLEKEQKAEEEEDASWMLSMKRSNEKAKSGAHHLFF